jgi:uncharacterized protein YdeI (YjbR/CyaY-like superfamily)
MKVPYAEKWQKETDRLREIALGCGLAEETKWGKPCFTLLRKNVAIVIPLKESCAFSFFKGALLKEPLAYPVPEELQKMLDENATLRKAFAALTPGRRKSYLFHIASAKQAATRTARAEKCVPMIMSGRGFNEFPG